MLISVLRELLQAYLLLIIFCLVQYENIHDLYPQMWLFISTALQSNQSVISFDCMCFYTIVSDENIKNIMNL